MSNMGSYLLKNEADDTKETWSELPTLLLWMIREKLQYIDNLQLAAVCKHWHYACMICSLQELQTANDRLPWLMVTKRRRWSEEVVVNVLNQKKYTIQHPSIPGTIPLASKEGWLLLAYPVMPLSGSYPYPSKFVFLLNPFTKKRINLPTALFCPSEAAISTLNGTPISVAVACTGSLHYTPPVVNLQILHPNNEERKTFDYNPGEHFDLVSHVFFINNDVYIADGFGHILRFNMIDSSWAEILEEEEEEEDETLRDIEQYIVERDGEVIKIIPIRDCSDGNNQISHFLFRKLNGDKTAWVKLNDYEMERKSWFLHSDKRGFSFVAKGTRRSEIYWLYNVNGRPNDCQMEVYDLVTHGGTISTVQRVATHVLGNTRLWVDLG